MALSINECFDPVEVIKLLRGMPLEQRYFALFLNFTLPKPVEVYSRWHAAALTHHAAPLVCL